MVPATSKFARVHAQESGTRVKQIRVAAYLGRDPSFAELLRERCRAGGIALRVAEDARQAEALAASSALQVFVVDLTDRDLLPEDLSLARLDAEPGSRGRLVVSRVEGEVTVVGFDEGEGELVCQRVLRTLGDARAEVQLEDLLLGHSEAIAEVRRQIRDVATFADINVLVLGETGTGKELVAQAIHRMGQAPDKPFLAVNCAAIPDTLFESELFGHRSGTFTGAQGGRVGLLEEAGSGTVFLDEVGEMPGSLQPKLLRALDTRTFRRIGANREQPFRARIVSATNREVHELAGLRRDLFYRLAGFTLQIPPLRRRPQDIEVLAGAFMRRFAEAHLLPAPRLGADALSALRAHRWPGNVRELKVVIERAAILARGGEIGARMITDGLHTPRGRPSPSAPPPAPPTSASHPEGRRRSAHPAPVSTFDVGGGKGLRDVEREIILRSLDRNGGNVARTARQLGIPRSTLRARLRRYGQPSGPATTSDD